MDAVNHVNCINSVSSGLETRCNTTYSNRYLSNEPSIGYLFLFIPQSEYIEIERIVWFTSSLSHTICQIFWKMIRESVECTGWSGKSETRDFFIIMGPQLLCQFSLGKTCSVNYSFHKHLNVLLFLISILCSYQLYTDASFHFKFHYLFFYHS